MTSESTKLKKASLSIEAHLFRYEKQKTLLCHNKFQCLITQLRNGMDEIHT